MFRLSAAAVVALALAAPGAAHAQFYVTQQWNRSQGDIDGKVGYPLEVSRPLASCPNDNWTSNSRIVSGDLPPGIEMKEDGRILGIPTERGHWIVQMEKYNLYCNGQSYPLMTFRQQLRFHVSGTGEVH
jgi:hypothetical protein